MGEDYRLNTQTLSRHLMFIREGFLEKIPHPISVPQTLCVYSFQFSTNKRGNRLATGVWQGLGKVACDVDTARLEMIR